MGAEKVIDIREQFPLERELTLKIAEDLGINHPIDNKTNTPIVIINGNFITDSNRKITEAVHIKQIRDKNRIIVSIEEKNKDTAWAKELKEIYESEGFKDYIKGKEIYNGFVLFGE